MLRAMDHLAPLKQHNPTYSILTALVMVMMFVSGHVGPSQVSVF